MTGPRPLHRAAAAAPTLQTAGRRRCRPQRLPSSLSLRPLTPAVQSTMQDTGHIVRKLGLEAAKAASVQGKASEYVRLATSRLGQGGLGQVGTAGGCLIV